MKEDIKEIVSRGNVSNGVDYLVDCEVRPLTMEFAREIASLNRVPNDRKITDSHLTLLHNDIEEGIQIPFNWWRAYCVETDEVYRLDGQHSSHLIVTGRIPCKGSVILTTFYCETLKQVVQIYNAIDNHLSVRRKRTVRDTALAVDGQWDDLMEYMKTSLQSAMCFALYGLDYANLISYQIQTKAMIEDPDFVNWVSRLFHGNRRFIKVGTIYAAYILYHIDKEKAEEFWESVFTGANQPVNSPILLLRDRISGSERVHNRQSIQWFDFATITLKAWKKWLAGEPVKMLRVPKGLSYLDTVITHKKAKILKFTPKSA